MRLTQIATVAGVLVALVLTPLAPISHPAGLASAQSTDPPGRVGRLSYMRGPVSYAPGGVDQWAEALLNYPLTTGTALWTDERGRAELRIGSTAVRMDQFTELYILNLDDQAAQLRVAQGTIDVGLYHLGADEQFEVATPTASLALVNPGHYRIQVTDDGTLVTVRSGRVDVATSTAAFAVQAGQTVWIVDTGSGTVAQLVATPALDEFGQWSLARQRREQQALQAASQYVSPAMTGYDDLVYHGAWRTVPTYGAVWFPRVPTGWAPYRDGRWVWISPWGWTWVDHAPWGFAPFHYGRWVLIDGIWAWVPVPRTVRPVFAPALVVFVIIGPTIGWFPLAPREVYVPPYRVSPTYFRTINITVVNINVVNITHINVTSIRYVHRKSPKAITVVRTEMFGGARPITHSIISVSQPDIERANVAATVPIRPDIRSILGRPEGSTGAIRPPVVVEQRPVIVRRTPPAPKPQEGGIGAPVRNVPVRPVADPRRGGTVPVQVPAPVVGPTPQPRPTPQVARPQPLPLPRQPIRAPEIVSTPQPRPTPQVVRPQPQPRGAPAPPRAVGPNRPPDCNPRSPNYDPNRCPQPTPTRTPRR